MNERRVFVARHAQTLHNAAAGAESQVDADRLSALGWEQGRRLGRLMARTDIRAIVTSGLARAHETAAAMTDSVQVPVQADERLREIVPPAPTGAAGEREAEHWSVYMARHADDRNYSVGGAESFEMVMSRVRGVVDNLSDRDRVLLITHAGFMRFLMGYLTWGEEFSPATLPRLWVFEVHNAGVSELRHVAERPGYVASEGWSIVTWMRLDHLEDL